MSGQLHYKNTPFLGAERSYSPGELILLLGELLVSAADPYRLQVAADIFIKPPQLLYHSCSPNAFINWAGLSLVADRHITEGEIISYHYGTSEFDYSVGAFTCQCGSPECLGHFKGFLFMSAKQQARLYSRASPYIQGLCDESGMLPK